MADDYDFQINNLKFRAAVNDQMPYQRATAPFRKDQFDSAPTVGDQSLTGWWTRGQLSFHKGAGLKYYEVLDGETILNRYLDSDAVDVWTAGQASLIPNLADLAVAATSATPGTLSGVSGLFYATATGMKFYDGSGNTAITTSDSGVPSDVTSDGRYYLAVNGDRIERQATTGALRTNYVTNPNFEVDTAGWAIDPTSTGTVLTRVTTASYTGSASMKVSNASVNPQAIHDMTGLTVGATYKLAARVKSGSSGMLLQIFFPGGSVTSSGSTDWELLSTTFVANATSQRLTTGISGTGSVGVGDYYIDSVMVTEFPCDVDYFDGSTVGGSWNGTANASTSTYAGASALRTNHVTNPSFEVDVAGWNVSSTSGSYSTTRAKYGSGSMKVSNTAGGFALTKTSLTGLTIGTTYLLKAWAYIPTGGATGAYISVRDTVPTSLLNLNVPSTRDAWVQVTGTFTATQTAGEVLIGHATNASVLDAWWDGIIVTEFPFEGDYFDGSTAGASWTGAANASKSTYASNSPAASYALWEHGDAGYEFQRVWWAKGRIWAVDNTGRWYTLSPAGGTAHVADAIWASGKTTAKWSLADSPGSVFIADSGTIYSLSVDVDGSAINLQAPVVAALLPAGEAISDMFYYLGHLIIATSKGVRVAQVQDSQLIYGPLVIEGDFSVARGIGAAGSLVYLVGKPTGHQASTLCVLDLTQEVDTLRPPWAPWVQLNNTTSTTAGALVDPSGRLFAWAGNLYGSGSTKAASGTITTGYHRFGTLDAKSFQTVSVRCGGAGGSITVYRVDADGTTTSLGTITPAEASKDFALGLTAPTERVALKFTLTRDGTDSTKGPELLGYQLKAMPVPVRQRLMKWPLTIMDTFRLRGGKEVGRAGRAYSDIKALEALESSAAVVTFTDHRTGETGSAYIDSVEFQSDTPSTSTTNGFGGVAYVTLRVLS